ncbi:MAG TPA: zinc ribbon domain-containing protein [Candidatus Sumerlaeota bacterium]|nr:zinc ribbon domain-containing protein [Candidatus Sumerlaeota bacterium]HOR29022.1 zinc ribbon domain-containing protein [Candidatus Sumerlaeota bacterium]HPK03700.1 zinc ribbon domain-containing protein [Candidatus Sumerlaeota bacterium]
MPIYEYQCDHCEHVMEVRESYSAETRHECPACGSGPMRKLLSAFSVGSGRPAPACAGPTCDPAPSCGAGGCCPCLGD